MTRAPLETVKHLLVQRIDALVPRLFPNARADGKEWRLGSIHGEPGQSLAIRRTGAKAGMARDFAAGQGYDLIDLIAAAECAGDIGAAIRWAERWLNLDTSDAEGMRQAQERAAKARAAAEAAAAREAADMKRRARGHFLSAAPIAGTPAAAYLQARHVDFDALGHHPGALRFKEMVDPETQTVRPVLLCAIVRGRREGIIAAHRIFLRQRADGLWTHCGKGADAPMKKGKYAYGLYEGGFIPLWKGASGTPIHQHDPGEWIAATEGPEDGLIVAQAQPQMRVISTVSLSNLGNLVLPPCKGLLWCADNDAKPAAISDMQRQLDKLAARGIATDIVRPDPAYKDFSEWAEALAKRREVA